MTFKQARSAKLIGATLWAMAKPDRPNFSIFGRIVFGVIALALIVMLLAFFGYIGR